MKPEADRAWDLFRRLLPALGIVAARCRPRALGWPLRRVLAAAGGMVGDRPNARRWRMVSLPLATALVAGIAAVVSLIDALRIGPQLREPDETILVAEPEQAAD